MMTVAEQTIKSIIDLGIKWDYTVLNDRIKELHDLYDESRDSIYLMEDDTLMHLFGCDGLRRYEKIASFCMNNDIQGVVDIGCAYGHQSEVFNQVNIEYLGVNDSKSSFWNEKNIPYVANCYPCQIPTKRGDLAISILCLTWNCYLYEGDKTLHEQCAALKRDFDHCLLYIQPDKKEIISDYFKHVEDLGEGFYYFRN